MFNDYVFPTDTFLLLGKVSKAHGMRGEVKILFFSGQPENMSQYREIVLVDKNGKLSPSLAVDRNRKQGKVSIVQLATISDRNKAEAVEGMGVLVDRSFLPPLADNEFYWHQYVSRTVLDAQKKIIGVVESIFSNGAQDIMIVKSGREEILIPISETIIVDDSSDEIIIDPPPGLLTLNSKSDTGGNLVPDDI